MNRGQKDRRRQGSSETTELGKVLHTCQKQLIVRLVAADIPYPNSMVLNASSKVVGKIDEVLGRLNEVFAAVKLNNESEAYRPGEMLFSYVDKFIPKSRFLPRAEVEKKKEERDQARSMPRGRVQESRGRAPERRFDRNGPRKNVRDWKTRPQDAKGGRSFKRKN